MDNEAAYVVQCCVCGKVRGRDGRFRLRRRVESDRISHTYCPKCAKSAMEEIASLQVSAT